MPGEMRRNLRTQVRHRRILITMWRYPHSKKQQTTHKRKGKMIENILKLKIELNEAYAYCQYSKAKAIKEEIRILESQKVGIKDSSSAQKQSNTSGRNKVREKAYQIRNANRPKDRQDFGGRVRLSKVARRFLTEAYKRGAGYDEIVDLGIRLGLTRQGAVSNARRLTGKQGPSAVRRIVQGGRVSPR